MNQIDKKIKLRRDASDRGGKDEKREKETEKMYD